ncbi:Uncharacterised protein [Yersinia ruckeri]|nr:FlxA-like family protein [Yersinia ruckeri]CNB27478.1 Uncharacterised protein [Yersinia ruckeri]
MSNTITAAPVSQQVRSENKASTTPTGSDAQAQIKALSQQIKNLTEKLNSLKDSDLPINEKQKQQQLIQN